MNVSLHIGEEKMMTDKKRSQDVSVLLRKLKQLGSPVDLSAAEEEVAEPRIEIAQWGPPSENRIFELDKRRAGYIFGLDFFNRTARPIYCPEIELCLNWEDPYFQWLKDPQERYRDVHHYSFPGKGGPQFPRDQVLNHLLLSETGVLQPRVPYQGWLLAVGRLMPKRLHDRVQVAATLVIVASDGTEYRQKILLVAERDGVKPESRQRASGLYQGPVARKIEPVVGESQRSGPGATSRVI
jgi:hypothetical protein